MTPFEKFQLCSDAAAKIVAAYRAEAPEGCDPQNSYVALAGVVVAGGTALYQSNQQKKQGEAAMSAMGQFKPINIPDMPKYIPVNLGTLQNKTVKFDKEAYRLSDADFKKRHGGIVAAENLFEDQVLKDQQGESELMPAVQNEFTRAGIGGALAAFGGNTGTLAPGSAGEAAVARNLGNSIVGFQDRNRTNRERSLLMAENLFNRRNIGISGADAGGVYAANVGGKNAWNQADFANTVQEMQFNATGGQNFANAQTAQMNTNAQAQALADSERNKALVSSAQMLAKLAAGNAGAGSVNTAPATYTTSASAAAAAPYAGGITPTNTMGYVPRAIPVKMAA
jgi:hypothetical protein